MEKKEKRNILLFWIVILFVSLGIIYLYNSNEFGEYNNCVDNCVYDNNDCIALLDYKYDSNGVEYADALDVEECSDDLEYCISGCK